MIRTVLKSGSDMRCKYEVWKVEVCELQIGALLKGTKGPFL